MCLLVLYSDLNVFRHATSNEPTTKASVNHVGFSKYSLYEMRKIYTTEETAENCIKPEFSGCLGGTVD